MLPRRCLGVMTIVLMACGSKSGGGAAGQSSSGGGGSSGGGSSSSSGVTPSGEAGPSGPRNATLLATALRGKTNFLIGMGNDLANDHNMDGAYTLGTTLDLHYAYLVGLQGMGGWPDWNANGGFVDIMCGAAKAHGVTPMFTLYSM